MSSYSLFTDISESKLLPSYWHASQYTAEFFAELSHLYLVALYILSEEEEFENWAIEYARKTSSQNGFAFKSNNGTDLYVLLYSLKQGAGFKDKVSSERQLCKMALNVNTTIQYLRDISGGRHNDAGNRRYLINLDHDLYISDPSLKSIRRLAMDWKTLDVKEKRLVITRMLQKLRSMAIRSEILPVLENLAKRQDLEIHSGSLDPVGDVGGSRAGYKIGR